MSKVLIYKQESGRISIVIPCADNLSYEGLIKLGNDVVPSGRKFKVVDNNDFPNDREHRDFWTVDDEYLTDGVGGALS